MEVRKYTVAGHSFAVRLQGPWRFMEYTPEVQQRIDSAAKGLPVETVPVRAGDRVPSRTLVRRKSELPLDCMGRLDFSQYEPFFDADAKDEDLIFTLSVHNFLSKEKESELLKDSKLVLKAEDLPPWYYVRMTSEGTTTYEFFPEEGVSIGIMAVSPDCRSGEFYPRQGFSEYTLLGQISMALMLMYTYATLTKDTLLMHSSVVRHNGKANLFLGYSGTGKSTHARLWVENIPGCDLINDDNPVVRKIGSRFYVFGTPWSGKTPCYRNVRCEVGAIVSLEQAPQNSISSMSGLQAYAVILSSSSSIKWIREDMDKFVRTVESLAMGVPCFHLKCLPDRDAALVCMDAVGLVNKE